jgi:hypothetical protein
MRKVQLLLITVALVFNGCATMDPAQQIIADLTVPTVIETTETNPLIIALDRLKDNPILTLAVNDSIRTLARIDTWKGRISESDEFDARQCPTRILLGAKNIQGRIEKAKAFAAGFDAIAKGLTDGKFEGAIEPLTVRKWGPPDEVGADQKAEFEATKEEILKDIRGIQRACTNLIPDRDIVRLMKEAAGLMK